MHDLLSEVERFRSWAAKYPLTERSGEWECDYANWHTLNATVSKFLDERPFGSWSADELSAVLYAIARDNEIEFLSSELGSRSDDLLMNLTEAALQHGEADAKWQLATQLVHATDAERREQLLQKLAGDENEYVRRRALQSLARTRSPTTEKFALNAWSRADEAQEWARMNALWALHHIGSSRLDMLLTEAERDERPYLSAYAAKVRNGEVDP